MKCFQHHEADAVGLCKNCSKGICLVCAVDLVDGLACKGSCEEKVGALNAMVSRSVQGKPWLASAWVYFLFGATATVVGALSEARFMLVMGGVFFLAGGIMFVMRKPKSPSKRQT